MSKALHEAVRWATKLHDGQDRDGDVPLPYICHPLEVVQTLRYVGHVTDPDMLVAAVLHDVVEETDATVEDVRGKFGEDVAGLVKELTRREPTLEDTNGLSKDEIWQLRADMLLEDVAAMGPRAQVVKLCDRISNISEAQVTKTPEKYERYREQTLRILATIPREVHPELWDFLKFLATEEDLEFDEEDD